MKKIAVAPTIRKNVFERDLDNNNYFQNNSIDKILADKIHSEIVDFGFMFIHKDIRVEVSEFFNPFDDDDFLIDVENLKENDGWLWMSRAKTKKYGNLIFRFDNDEPFIEVFCENCPTDLVKSSFHNSYEATGYRSTLWQKSMYFYTHDSHNCFDFEPAPHLNAVKSGDSYIIKSQF